MASASRAGLAVTAIVAAVLGGGVGWLMHDRNDVTQMPAPESAASSPIAVAGPVIPETRTPFEIERDERIEARLNAYAWPKFDCMTAPEPCLWRHGELAHERIHRKDKRIDVFVYGSVIGDGGGHAAKAPLSVVEVDDKGRVINASIAFTEGGIYGRPMANAERYSVVPLNDREYAVVIEENDMHFGEAEETLRVVMFTDGLSSGSFGTEIGGNYDERGHPKSDWKGKWMLVQVPNGDPELVITKRGMREGRPLDTVERFQWTGRTFAPIALPVPAAASAARSADSGASDQRP